MRTEVPIEAFKFLRIESRFLAAELTGANVPPCSVSMASDVSNRTIFAWRLCNSSSLAKATVLALDSILERASDADPRESRVGHHYRYGNSEYVVTSAQDDCVWLERRDSPRRNAAKLGSHPTHVYHSVAMHAISGDVLGWDLSDSLQYAIHASLTNGVRCGEKGPHYIVDSGLDAREIPQALNDLRLDVRFHNSNPRKQSAKIERFFHDFNLYLIEGVAGDSNTAKKYTMTLRKKFEEWLKAYQQGSNAIKSDTRKFGHKFRQKFCLHDGDK